MEKIINNRLLPFKHINCLMLVLLLVGGGITLAGEGKLNKGDVTNDGLTVMKSTGFTEMQIKSGITWAEYTKYQISPVEVSFRKNWKRDYNRDQKSLAAQVTDEDMARIKETMGKIVFEEFDKALQEKGGFIKADQADSNTLLFKPRIIDLDVYAPDVQNSSVISKSYIRQAGRATLFLEVFDAVSGEIIGRWIDTREDPDRGYYDWANRITNAERARLVVNLWVKRLIEGLENLKAGN
jgi:hypothetical protein